MHILIMIMKIQNKSLKKYENLVFSGFFFTLLKIWNNKGKKRHHWFSYIDTYQHIVSKCHLWTISAEKDLSRILISSVS